MQKIGDKMSILDNDFYKFKMHYVIWKNFRDVKAEYSLYSRKSELNINKEIFAQVTRTSDLRFTNDEIDYLGTILPIDEEYKDHLRYGCKGVFTDYYSDSIVVEGLWSDVMLYEIPFLSRMSEILSKNQCIIQHQFDRVAYEMDLLDRLGVNYVEFGTRRRMSKSFQWEILDHGFNSAKLKGTSNVLYCKQHDITPVGTVGHEWIMGVAGMSSPEFANVLATLIWLETYPDYVALTDTYTTEQCLKELSLLGKEKDRVVGYRHDSGCPIEWTDKIMNTIPSGSPVNLLYSDGLHYGKIIRINKHLEKYPNVNATYCIGTNFTNSDVSPPSIIYKPKMINGKSVYKTTDDPSKKVG